MEDVTIYFISQNHIIKASAALNSISRASEPHFHFLVSSQENYDLII